MLLVFSSGTFAQQGPNEILFQSGFEEENLLDTWQSIRTQIQYPGSQPSKVYATTDKKHSGNKSLYCFADGAPGSAVNKADIYTSGELNLAMGQTYRISAWYWIPENTYIKTVTIMDIECSECDQSGAGPRIWIDSRRDPGEPPRLTFGRGKLGLPSMHHEPVEQSTPIPVGRWFKLTVEVKLGQGNNGRSRVWIDDQLEIDFVGSNIMPENHPDGYKLDHYDFLQFGLTANGTATDPNGQLTAFGLYVDDVLIEQINVGGTPPPDTTAPASPKNVRIE
jgi:hypothetical protein